MEEIAHCNRDFLDSNFPGLSDKLVSPSAAGSLTYISGPFPNIRVDGRTVHSKQNPEREASHLVRDIPLRDSTVVLFLGLGFGYQIEKFRELYADCSATLIVVERSAEIFSLLCDNKDIAFLKGTHLFVGDVLQEIHKFIGNLGALNFSGYHIVKLRGSYTLHREYYDGIETFFKETLSGKISDLLTRFAFETLWVRNIIDNMPSLVGMGSIASLRELLRGQPVLIVNAGPSLLPQLELLHHMQERIHLIAVDTALPPLLKSGIFPDFVVTLDAGFFNALDFRHLFLERPDYGNMKLVADIVTNPIILRHWRGTIVFSETSEMDGAGHPGNRDTTVPLLNTFHTYFPHIETLVCGGSISTTALELALHMGANPVYTTALDLSYTDYKTHVNSSAHYDVWYQRSSRLQTLATSMVQAIGKRKLTYVKAIGGQRALSDFVFSQYIRWIEGHREYRNRVFNCTAAGAAIRDIPHVDLRSLAEGDRLPLKKRPVHVKNGGKLTAEQAIAFLDMLTTTVRKAQEDIDEIVASGVTNDRYDLFQTILAEARKLYSSPESFSRYLTLFFTFTEKHIRRARSLLEREPDG